MNARKLMVKLVALACCGAVSGVAMADTQEEIDKQISNMIGNAISSRIAVTAPKAASAALANGAYGGIVNVDVKFGGTNTSTNAYYAGVDHNFSKELVGGAALFYSAPNNSRTTGISPYLAYLLNENLYLMGKLNYADTNGGGSSTDTLGTDVSINGLLKSGNLLAKGGLGIGGSSSETNTAGATTKSSVTLYSANGELGYTFAPTWQAVAGLNLNSTNKDNSYSATASIGLEKEISKDAAIAFKYSTNVDDNQPTGTTVKVNVYTLSARFRF